MNKPVFEYEEIKVTKHQFEILCKNFMYYFDYEKNVKKPQKNCIVCKEKFKTNEQLGLLISKKSLNKLCCYKCSEKLEQKGECDGNTKTLQLQGYQAKR